MHVRCVIAALLIFALSGCVVVPKKCDSLKDEELRKQLSLMQAQLNARDEEILVLKSELSKPVEPQTISIAKADIPVKNTVPTVKNIQTALKNAGFDPGVIDGKIGAKTLAAIKNFQAENDLKADGKVGKKTWALLQKHL